MATTSYMHLRLLSNQYCKVDNLQNPVGGYVKSPTDHQISKNTWEV